MIHWACHQGFLCRGIVPEVNVLPLLFVLGLSHAQAPTKPPDRPQREVRASLLNVRAAPNAQAGLICKLLKGKRVQVYETSKTFARVANVYCEGWVVGSFLSPASATRDGHRVDTIVEADACTMQSASSWPRCDQTLQERQLISVTRWRGARPSMIRARAVSKEPFLHVIQFSTLTPNYLSAMGTLLLVVVELYTRCMF